VIELDDVSVRLGDRIALDRARLDFRAGELVAVLGPNGAGKTTLLKAIAGLVPARGRVVVGGEEVAAMPPGRRALRIAYLPQGHVAHWPISVADAVAIGRLAHGSGPGRLRDEDAAAIASALAATDTAHLAGRAVTGLSSGERARVMLARALAVEAPILLVDEPIAALDPAHQLAVLELLARTAAGGTVVLAVLHDLTLAARFASRAVVLDQGRIAADGPPGAVLGEALLADVFRISSLRLTHEGAPVLVPWLPRADLRR
jgi:iron complex transport system ATP-binding protein